MRRRLHEASRTLWRCWSGRRTSARSKFGAVLEHSAIAFLLLQLRKNLIGSLHTHAAEIGHEMHAVGMACKLAFGTFPRLFPSKWKHVAAMAAPICTHVGKRLEAMRNAMIDLLFVRIGLCVRFADTLRDDFWVARFVAGILTVRALHARSIFEEVSAKCASHDVVESLDRELMPILFDDVFLLLANGTFTTQTNVKAGSLFCLLDKTKREMDSTYGFQSEPGINEDRACLSWLTRARRSPCCSSS